MSDIGYPLMRRWPLGPARGVFNRYRSRLQDVPTDRAGYAVVLDVHGTLEEVPNGIPLVKADGIGRATSAIFVDLRPRTIEIVVAVPCHGRYTEFETHVTYDCDVTHAVAAVERNATDVRAELRSWTAAALRRAGENFAPDDALGFEDHAEIALRRAFRETPPACRSWMDVDLVSVAVPLSTKYRDDGRAREDVTMSTTRRIHEIHEGERLADAKLDAGVAGDGRDLRRRRHQIASASRIFELEAGLDDQRLARESRLLDARVTRYREALAAGPDAMMALIAEQNPSDMKQFLALKLQERADLMQFVFEAIDRKIIDPIDVGSGIIDVAKHIIQGVRRDVPGFAALTAPVEGGDAPADGGGATEDGATASADHDDNNVIDIDPARIVEDADHIDLDTKEFDLSFLDVDADPAAGPSVNGKAGHP